MLDLHFSKPKTLAVPPSSTREPITKRQRLNTIKTKPSLRELVLPEESQEDPGVADDVRHEEENILRLGGLTEGLLQVGHARPERQHFT